MASYAGPRLEPLSAAGVAFLDGRLAKRTVLRRGQ